jgi:tRNA threonylcarbamoyladenosine biosynthesis protein TsaE
MEKVEKVFVSKSAESTKSFAKNLARKIRVGDILALYGPLGAGKTTFVQGLAAGLGYKDRVFSPTFIFVRPYQISNQESVIRNQKDKIKTLYHIDLYRVEEETDLKTIGLEEFLTEDATVSVIEWPEKIENKLPAETIKIKIEVIGENERRIKVDG